MFYDVGSHSDRGGICFLVLRTVIGQKLANGLIAAGKERVWGLKKIWKSDHEKNPTTGSSAKPFLQAKETPSSRGTGTHSGP